ncbi:MAG: cation diffusion facilitator family transporter [Dehalococcoidales bacterium]
MAGGSSKKPVTVYAAMIANFLIAISKFIVATITKSSAMLSEGIHSVADTGNQALLLLGIHLSRRPADDTHPFGYGKDLYFWSLIVAIILFGVGGGMSLYEGFHHIQDPVPLDDPTWNYVVLGLGVLFELFAFITAFRALTKVAGKEAMWQAVRSSKDPTIFVVLFEDAAALTGLLVAFLGVHFSHRLEMPILDGVASLVIGVILMTVSILIAFESRQLLLGEAADPMIVSSVKKIVSEDDDILDVFRPMTMHLGPNEVLLNMGLNFKKGLSTSGITRAIVRL